MSPNNWARYAVIASAGAVVLSSAACGGSENKPAESSPGPASTTATRHAGAMDHAGGVITSVTGHTAQVTTRGGTADIDFNTMTKITEIRPAELSDVVVGSCVSVIAGPPGAAPRPVVADRVLISARANDQCALQTPPPEGAPPPPGGPEGPPPGPGAPAPPPFGGPSVQGAVASVSGNTIVVTNTDPSGAAEIQTEVEVTTDTRYDKRQPAESAAITTGKCADARGTKNAAGVLQATTIDLGPATDGQCGPPRP